MSSLKDRTVLVVGRGSGLARAIVLAALEGGARVVAAGRDQAGLAAAYAGEPGVVPEFVDLTDEASIAALGERLGTVDHVVSTASARARGMGDMAVRVKHVLRHAILPAITLGLFQMTLIMRLVRAEMLEVLRTDYIKFARARGLTDRAIHFGHALRNTLVPVITVAGLQFGSVIAFAIITETVFQWPGMGLLFVQAVQNVDIPIMAAYLLMVSLIFVTINLIVDILYTVVDPRLRSTIGRPA